MELVKTSISSSKKDMFRAFLHGRYSSAVGREFELLKTLDTDKLCVVFESGEDATEFTLRNTEDEFNKIASNGPTIADHVSWNTGVSYNTLNPFGRIGTTTP